MDGITSQIVGYVTAPETASLSPAALHATKRRLVDSFACALGAIQAPPARIARELAAEATGSFGATAIGLETPTTVELAAFANSVMVRFLDYNDMYFTARGGGGHPSDMIPGALAVGEARGASGLQVLEAIALGYEINGALASAVWLRERGWDQGLNIVAAVAMMAGRLLDLDADELGHALALAVTPNVPVRQTRIGHLSMWKGSATAGAVRNGIFAARLASKGMTGPPEPFEGRSGIWELVTGPFELTLPVRSDGLVVEDISTKPRPAEYNAQGPIDLALDARAAIDLDDIEAIDLHTYHLAVHEIGSDPAKWDPHTRETADHSLPYLLTVALVDGRIDEESCSPERIADPALRTIMDRVRIHEDPAATEAFPEQIRSRLEIRLRDGRIVERETAYPLGHQRNPLPDADLTAKFETMARHLSDADQAIAADLLERLWSFDAVEDVGAVLEPLGRLSGVRRTAVGSPA